MKIKTVIFDLFGVLFFLNTRKILQQVGITNTFFYYIKYKKTPFTASFELLDKMRKEYPGEYQDVIAYKGNFLPQSLCLWQRGQISNDDALSRVFTFTTDLFKKRNFRNNNEYKLFINVLHVMFDSEYRIKAVDLNKKLFSIIEDLKRMDRNLFILSNIDRELLASLQEKYPQVFDLFDDITTSCTTNLLKPEPTIFEYLLTKHHLNAAECLFVDDQQENIKAAQKFGIQSLLYTKKTNISAYL